ncbi:hypothetical protein BHM03_00001584 [Ensete ventricosum]|nr:hypothetical protein BHM03_00001584 [Ensete ventricosum]
MSDACGGKRSGVHTMRPMAELHDPGPLGSAPHFSNPSAAFLPTTSFKRSRVSRRPGRPAPPQVDVAYARRKRLGRDEDDNMTPIQVTHVIPILLAHASIARNHSKRSILIHYITASTSAGQAKERLATCLVLYVEVPIRGTRVQTAADMIFESNDSVHIKKGTVVGSPSVMSTIG